MTHGQHNTKIRRSPVSQSPEQENTSEYPNAPKTEENQRIITIKETSQTAHIFWPWNSQELSLKEDSGKIVKLSVPQKVQKPSRQVCFWEALMTVALLIMALWMQSLPARQIPEIIDSNHLPSFEMIKRQSQL